jgi:lysine 2,3-aminomutase
VVHPRARVTVGSRINEFHPWGKKITPQRTYIAKDVPIYEYLSRLEAIGENVDEYENIWFYL